MNKTEQSVYDNFKQIWFDNSIEAVDNFFHDTVIVNSQFGSHIGVAGKKELIQSWSVVFPKRKTRLCDVTSNETAFFLSWKCSALQVGTLFGIPDTGKELTFTGSCCYKLKDKKVIEYCSASNIVHVLKKSGYNPQVTQAKIDKNHFLAVIKVKFNGKLSTREIEVLALNIHGYTDDKTSILLGIAKKTVENIRYSALHSLNIKQKQLCEFLYEENCLFIFIKIARMLETTYIE